MSSVTSSEAAVNAFVNIIRPNFDCLIIATAFSACLLTLFVVLFALSTKESRRRLAFRLNVLALCLALTTSILSFLTDGKSIVDPFNPVSTSVYLAAIVVTVFPPLLYDSILLTRLFALYPLSSTPPTTLLKIFSFPFCVKCARVVAITVGIHHYVVPGMTTEVPIEDASSYWFRSPYLIAEWTLQIADNLYSVSFFLYNLHIRTSPIKRAHSIAERIQQIFYVSVANFVFPLMFNIAQIILVTTDRSPTAGAVVLLINNYVTVMGVLCATLWFSGSERVRTRNELLPEHMLNSPRTNFGSHHVADRKSGSSIILIGRDSVTHDTTSLDTGTDRKHLTTPEKENKYILV
ncbi:hypothetical protein BKA82DRAFT_35362 [Pisolithus tinctorius]|uniref:G-protein coupled receptors family 1 profile domain-containing protein n=1 Tax=Pisolithus tinctorius Marx 270 TaxID=870435 RepID=A0A0C3MYY2_PISTI|nr:hypothetical protein BKA82DRAFT_4483827 [Pisolithus tinctorius]KAI6142331.1 hypothetical protein BKA82DRAFT_4360725 [Pisolithus tinctorius]KAI6146061.1 hypothetical protein BKA82DRAFT_4357386 [Pisolithus tinctorius]KAI6148154.1 hypothetical protein BKA82DRAFT_35362 [Pisolithus tinctorius]KIN94109.1 hypothetical protein M404DRAFT_35362 [Pisolithus tinctorius Marx 270]